MASDIAFAWPRVDGFVLSILGLHYSKPWRYSKEKKGYENWFSSFPAVVYSPCENMVTSFSLPARGLIRGLDEIVQVTIR
jgi:hypothetical protein